LYPPRFESNTAANRRFCRKSSSKMAVEDNAKRIEEAKASQDPAKSEKIYKDILSKAPGSSDRQVRDFENALVALGELYRDQKRADDLANLISQTRDVLTSFTRAKTAKLGMPTTKHMCLNLS
jgi:26S proteasome regulatory subunit N6